MSAPAPPRRNRVTPAGEIVATPERGLLMGNRGILHDRDGRVVRRWASPAWIACLSEFRGRRRALMTPGRYTELFFLDEATALAAGHRPCFECRRDDARRFRAALAEGLGLAREPSAGEVDRLLDAQRLVGPRGRRVKRTWPAPAAGLADGVMAAAGGQAHLVLGGRLLAWGHGGYGRPRPLPAGARIEVLTPPAVAAALAAGYRPLLHPSAGA